jgi:hypothetical protein
MNPVSQSDFNDWRSNAVTKAFMSAASERIIDAMYNLSNTAGIDSGQDSFMRGFIAAYRELESFRIDDLQE